MYRKIKHKTLLRAILEGCKNMKKISDFLSIGDAAKFLGVTPNTLKNWEYQKKLRTYRNPQNQYRLYDKQDLEKLLKGIISIEQT